MNGFRMYGRVVEVLHYQATYTEQHPTQDGEPTDVITTIGFPTQEEAQAVAAQYGGTVTPLDSSAYDWMDGLEVADVPDTYAEAMRIYELGQEAYTRQADLKQRSQSEQLRADLDYIMLMEGL